MGNESSQLNQTIIALEQMEREAIEEVQQQWDFNSLQQVKARYLGRKGVVQAHLKGLSKLPVEERPGAGQAANRAKNRIVDALENRNRFLSERQDELELATHAVDVSLPGRSPNICPPHPITRTFEEVMSIFQKMGFSVATGPEAEHDQLNFDALNFPKEHPARDMQDTLFLNTDGVVMRTHTSPVQVRTMLRYEPPLRVICPGKVFRCDTPDASHSPVFHQVEGLMVDNDVSFAELKGILASFVLDFFGTDKLRFRPSFFPFTEPSAEVDMACVFCKGKGCGVCKGTGWVEIMGAGMVNPNVFRAVGYDPEEIMGFAFGMGVDRMAILKYGIPDIRLLFEGDIRFLSNF